MRKEGTNKVDRVWMSHHCQAISRDWPSAQEVCARTQSPNGGANVRFMHLSEATKRSDSGNAAHGN